MTEPPPEKPDEGRRWLGMLAMGSLGFLLAFALAVLYGRPDVRRSLEERWRHGVTSTDGVLMTLSEVAPGGSLALTFVNVGQRGRTLVFPEGDRAGIEVDVTVTDASGNVLPSRPPEFDPATPAASAAIVTLAPGERHVLPLDLARFVSLPGPGRYSVVVDRARLAPPGYGPPEPRLRSNLLEVRVR